MPQNKKEGLIFTLLMCFQMVLGMSIYNLFLHHSLSFSELIKGLLPAFIVALILDIVIVGPLAKNIARRLPLNQHKKWQLILSISTLMVIGMVTFMSLFGVFMNNMSLSNLSHDYPIAWRSNILLALPLQLILVGPFSRYLLRLLQR